MKINLLITMFLVLSFGSSCGLFFPDKYMHNNYALADLSGDGKMEIVPDTSYY